MWPSNAQTDQTPVPQAFHFTIMSTASAPLAEQELQFRVVYSSQAPDNSEPIGLAIDTRGVFLAIAFKNFVVVYECSETSANEAQENWALKCTYDLQDSGASINSISWASTGVLAVAFDTGDVSLALLDSRVSEIPSAWFRSSNMI